MLLSKVVHKGGIFQEIIPPERIKGSICEGQCWKKQVFASHSASFDCLPAEVLHYMVKISYAPRFFTGESEIF